MKQLSSTVVYSNQWMTLREDAIELADGSQSIYGVIERNDFAVVLPRETIDGVEGFWLVEQYRYPIQEHSLELPQGSWAKGKQGNPEELAHAELNEETGLRAGSMRHLGRMWQSVGSSTQGFDIWLATDLTPGEQSLEPSELGMVARFVPDDELFALITSGVLKDSTTVAAIGLWRLQQA